MAGPLNHGLLRPKILSLALFSFPAAGAASSSFGITPSILKKLVWLGPGFEPSETEWTVANARYATAALPSAGFEVADEAVEADARELLIHTTPRGRMTESTGSHGALARFGGVRFEVAASGYGAGDGSVTAAPTPTSYINPGLVGGGDDFVRAARLCGRPVRHYRRCETRGVPAPGAERAARSWRRSDPGLALVCVVDDGDAADRMTLVRPRAERMCAAVR